MLVFILFFTGRESLPVIADGAIMNGRDKASTLFMSEDFWK